MILNVYCVYDSKVEAYLPPFTFRTTGECLRYLSQSINDPSSNFSKNAADFTLFELGKWSDIDCKYDLLKTPNNLGVFIQFKKDLPSV